MALSHDGLQCAFCGKSQQMVRHMIQGQLGAGICDDCVDLCSDILSDIRAGRVDEFPSWLRMTRAAVLGEWKLGTIRREEDRSWLWGVAGAGREDAGVRVPADLTLDASVAELILDDSSEPLALFRAQDDEAQYEIATFETSALRIATGGNPSTRG